MPSEPMVAIGLDALDCSELKRRVAQGEMPNVARVAERSGIAWLAPDTPGFGGMTWPGFINGAPIAQHGWYFSKFWSPDTGRIERTSPDFQCLRGFWEPMMSAGLRLGLIDVPYAPTPPAHFDGVYVNGWQTHDLEQLRSKPEALLGTLEERFGAPLLHPEHYGLQRAQSLIGLRQNVLDAIGQITEITEWLLQRDRFDFFMVVLGAPHRAGHYLWDLSQIDPTELTNAERRMLEGTIDDVYEACDEAVGRIAAAAPDFAVTAFAVHGMRANPGWNEVFPEILQNLMKRPGDTADTHGLREFLRGVRRTSLAMRVTRNLPPSMRRLIGHAWSSRMHDWSTTRFFTLPSEVAALVRLNVDGREPSGIVNPSDYTELCDQLAAELGELRDLETDELIVDDVHITDQMISSATPYRRYLPDLLVEWGDRRLTDSIGVRLANGHELRWPRGRRLSSGRSGDHSRFGWTAGDLKLASERPMRPTTIDLACSFRKRAELDTLDERIAAHV